MAEREAERALITQEKLKKCAYMAMVEEEIITWALRELRTKASCDPIASLAPSSQLTSPSPSLSRCSRNEVQRPPAVVRRAGLYAREDADAVMLRRASALPRQVREVGRRVSER